MERMEAMIFAVSYLESHYDSFCIISSSIDQSGNGTVKAKDGSGEPIHLTLQDGVIRVSEERMSV